MANPTSSSHHREGREHRDSRHHHHRTISSTTLLLVLSLVLAVLAVMLSMPSFASESSGGFLGYVAPKRSQTLAQREHAVALREAAVASREADLLANKPGGQTLPALVTTTRIVEEGPVQTVYEKVVKEEALTAPGWYKDANLRVDELLAREAKISDREKDVNRREESLNRREHDAARREAWIMDQLSALGGGEVPAVEEEIVYETPKRKPKALPSSPPVSTLTHTVTVPMPSHTRRADLPKPLFSLETTSSESRPTHAVEVEYDYDEDEDSVVPTSNKRRTSTRRAPRRWWW